MFFKKSILSESHNWLLYHYYIKNIEKNLRYFRGTLLDVGCGKKPYKDLFATRVSNYVGLEYVKTIHGFQNVDVVGDSMDLPFKDNSFDNAVSFQVLEHVREPLQFLDEVFRVIKPSGFLLLTTPFMWGEHEAPFDYFRYTRYGLTYLAEKAGFEIISIEPDSKYWSMAVLRFNYYLIRFARGPFKNVLKVLFTPLFTINQTLAYILDKLPHNYTIDTIGFTTLLRKSTKQEWT